MLELNKIYQGDCLERLKELDDNSIDAIVTDPPAGISFMGKSWDTFDKSMFGKKGEEGEKDLKVEKNFEVLPRYANADLIGFQEFICQVFKECYRVLKPGAYAVVWAIPRTSHHTAIGIERAGFEIRDVVHHIFNTGFPKSLNIGKAFDKVNGADIELSRRLAKYIGINIRKIKTDKELASILGRANNSHFIHHWINGTYIPRFEELKKLRKYINIPEEFKKDWELLENKAKRESLGFIKTNKTIYQNIGRKNESGIIEITKGNSEFEGLGTALKPACEHWILARKPIEEKSIVENVIKYGTGGIDIDGCRIPIELNDDVIIKNPHTHSRGSDNYDSNCYGKYNPTNPINYNDIAENSGRFPANVIVQDDALNDNCFGDKGSKSRYFDIDLWAERNGIIQIAKPSKSEKNKGCEDLEPKNVNDGRSSSIDNAFQRGDTLRTNTHPTVKSIALMSWLVKLVSKENDIVLDPFAGSGTTLIASKILNRNYIGFEKEEEYIKIIESRLNAYVRQKRLL